ncbi:cysteine hydrolase family protein [Pseudogulbenkiania subflava]|uniref:Nicotinamidase-related amidase n=1 Tax=Pseudogulbenkiania subflava DSM 22618 TaxID=1123014 RepID=A0A1Y6C226_9NEIS|nr:cysteine hydrolase family protein [Pseudogulbenkiania subflava]SMF31498.1 Nicotinamidase-related amidase [Pseudogulbenkiania subflava DSM 22618]
MKTALLIIDVQRGLFDDEPRPYEADAVVERINTLAGRTRAHGVPVVFIQHERASGNLAHGTESWQLERHLRTVPGDHFIRKTTPDSFLRTPLQALLEQHQINHVVICGYASEFCVDTTTRRAAALGYAVTLASDAHTTHDKAHASAAAIREHENATLPDIVSFGPTILAKPGSEIAFVA